MNLRQLEAFHEVMITGSVTESARNLGRTKPGISAQIAALEDDVGYKLFDRRGGRLHPVPEAHYLMDEARDILTRLGALERNMKDVGALEAGHLRIAILVPAHKALSRLAQAFIAFLESEITALLAAEPSAEMGGDV